MEIPIGADRIALTALVIGVCEEIGAAGTQESVLTSLASPTAWLGPKQVQLAAIFGSSFSPLMAAWEEDLRPARALTSRTVVAARKGFFWIHFTFFIGSRWRPTDLPI